jgi:DNA-binding NarL/FixJ family response regulator
VNPIRVFLVDDHEVVRQGLQAMLDHEDDIRVVGQAATAADALATIPAADAEVVLLDLNLPDGSGIEVCRTLAPELPATRFLILTSVSDDEALLGAILAGAAGYVLKHVRGDDLLTTVRRVAAGEFLLTARAREQVVSRLRRSVLDTGTGLSAQEQHVFELLADGLTNRGIADRLGLTEKTVKNYVSNVLAKLGLHRRTEAAVLAATLAEEARTRPRADARNPIRY